MHTSDEGRAGPGVPRARNMAKFTEAGDDMGSRVDHFDESAFARSRAVVKFRNAVPYARDDKDLHDRGDGSPREELTQVSETNQEACALSNGVVNMSVPDQV